MLADKLLLDLAAFPEGRSREERSAIRRAQGASHPAYFGLIYFRHWLKGPETDDRVTLARPHLEWAQLARRWADRATAPNQDRHVFVAPRALGKTSWWFGIIPMWLAAYGHRRFVVAFADTAAQAEQHLETFRRELDTNRLLQQDFPELCAPLLRTRKQTVADNRAMLQTASGFAFAARGIDSGSLGLKVGTQRPDLLVLDDVEPDEGSYSPHQAERRLGTITDAVLALNIYAPVVWTGTTTMNGSLVHQAVRSVKEPAAAPWVAEEGWTVHHHLPIVDGPDGGRVSVWPEKWPLDYLDSISHTRAYAKNYLNQPRALDGDYWSEQDLRYAADGLAFARTVIYVDPAVTAKRTSDYTGIVVASSTADGHTVIREAVQVKLPPAALRGKVAATLEAFPEVRVLIVETNQGADLWAPVFAGLPIKYREVKNSVPKDVRITWLLNAMQRGTVTLGRRLPVLEAQMLAYPQVVNDDVIDAAAGATVGYLCPPTGPTRHNRATARSREYV